MSQRCAVRSDHFWRCSGVLSAHPAASSRKTELSTPPCPESGGAHVEGVDIVRTSAVVVHRGRRVRGPPDAPLERYRQPLSWRLAGACFPPACVLSPRGLPWAGSP